MSSSVAAQMPAASLPPFSQLYESQFEFVYGFLRRLGAPVADLEDLTQEVFVIAHRRLPSFDAKRPVKPWLFGIAFRVLADKKRGLKNNHEPEPLDEDMADLGPGPECEMHSKEARALVQKALETLEFHRRAVFVMHDMQGESAPEISRILDVPLNTVYSRLRLARRDFTVAIRQLLPHRVTP